MNIDQTAFISAKDSVLHKVVYAVLGREFYTEDELKDFSIVIYAHDQNREFISYKGKVLGELAFNITNDETSVKMHYNFIPNA